MPSSTIDNAISSTKSFIESFTSSDNPTTTFTEHTVASVTKHNGILSKILGFVSQPKFKWYILGLLLCIVAFVYFKFQNKPKKDKTETFNVENKDAQSVPVENKNQPNQNINLLLEERDKEWVNKINTMKQQYNTQLATQADVNAQLIAQLQASQRPKPQVPQHVQQTQSRQTGQKPTQPVEQLTESASSEEIFIEDKNVMEHNLTAEEMNAIDKQLEDVNLDHLMHASE
jgi:hypothetical protein